MIGSGEILKTMVVEDILGNEFCYEVCYADVLGGKIAVRRIAVKDTPDTEMPTLVFLHEGLGCIGMWKDFPAALSAATGCQALVYDRFGHGKSSAEKVGRDLSFFNREAHEVLPALFAACGVTDAILIGHSDGGTIALLYAGCMPLRGVITEAAHVFVEQESLDGVAAAKQTWQDEGFRIRLARYHGDLTASMFGAWSKMWEASWFRNWNIEAALPSIRCPLLVIQGAEDEYGTQAQVQAIVRGVSGQVDRMIVPHCGHAPHIQARQVVLERMSRFIRSLLD